MRSEWLQCWWWFWELLHANICILKICFWTTLYTSKFSFKYLPNKWETPGYQTTRSLVGQYPHFEGTCCLHLQGRSAGNYSNVNASDCIFHIYVYILCVCMSSVLLQNFDHYDLWNVLFYPSSFFNSNTVFDTDNLVRCLFLIFHILATYIIITRSRRYGFLITYKPTKIYPESYSHHEPGRIRWPANTISLTILF